MANRGRRMTLTINAPSVIIRSHSLAHWRYIFKKIIRNSPRKYGKPNGKKIWDFISFTTAFADRYIYRCIDFGNIYLLSTLVPVAEWWCDFDVSRLDISWLGIMTQIWWQIVIWFMMFGCTQGTMHSCHLILNDEQLTGEPKRRTGWVSGWQMWQWIKKKRILESILFISWWIF